MEAINTLGNLTQNYDGAYARHDSVPAYGEDGILHRRKERHDRLHRARHGVAPRGARLVAGIADGGRQPAAASR